MTVLQGPSCPAPPVQAARAAVLRPADFAVPTGREEECRFTPLRPPPRLQGALPECKVTVETDPAPEVAASRAERGHRRGSCELHCGSI
jgi:hypothetical protein